MEELDTIIIALQETMKLCDLAISDEVLLEQAIKIYLSNKINESKKENIALWNNKQPEYSFNKQESYFDNSEKSKAWTRVDKDKPTDKQIYFLKKNKIKIPNTRMEATELIKKLKKE